MKNRPQSAITPYLEQVHTWGRISMAIGLLVMLMVPASISLRYGAWPQMGPLLKGLLGVAPIFWTVGIIEAFTFAPMLGSGGSYLSFITGNLTSLKVPCALNAMEAAGVKASTPEGEVISTIAVAASSMTTTLVLTVGVLLLGQIRPVLERPELAPVFANILPALFGAMGAVYISKNPRLAVAPLVFMVALFIAVPSLSSSVGILVPVGALITLAVARVLYKQGKL